MNWLRTAIVSGAIGLPLLAGCARPDTPPVAAGPRAAAATAAAETERTRAVAIGFLTRMFVDGDMRGAYDRFVAPDFRQHNPEIGDGIAAHRAFFAEKASHGPPLSAWTNVTNMLLVDGDLFALHHHVFAGPGDAGRVFVDIWRVSAGRIVEHWDVIETRPATMAHGNGMACGKGEDPASARLVASSPARPTCGLPDPGSQRAASVQVIENYATQLRSGDVRGAIARWLAPGYRQHSPAMADGRAGALAFLQDQFGGGAKARPQMGPIRVIAEGDYVLHHRLTTYPDGRKTANVDIFRVTKGRISEHWDLKQDVPQRAANSNTMW